MPKIKVPVKTPRVDMTPMVDLFSLLLTFFMLTATFRPQEAVVVETPKSISDVNTPDKNVMTLTISKNNKVYFDMDNGPDSTTRFRSILLDYLGKRYNIQFTPVEFERFVKLSSFGLPINNMKTWLDAPNQAKRDEIQQVLEKQGIDGIPMDSTKNELKDWILYARSINPNMVVSIKGDQDADYATVKKVLDILQENKVSKFNLTTNLVKVDVKMDEQ